MPYNTRRKSLSLPSLGIHVPITHAERAAAAATAAAQPHRRSSGEQRVLNTPCHPSKKQKLSHDARNDPSISASLHSTTSSVRGGAVGPLEQTPPPSPKATSSMLIDDDVESSCPGRIVDPEGIHDDIVKEVIAQLQSSTNRPHLLKELATILSQRLPCVRNSANPCAIVSSRLSTYLRRGCWSALTPCPLAKELEAVHPRRTFYYLTTRRRQPLPDMYQRLAQRTVMSPSISSLEPPSDEDDDRRQRELSPSPEVELSPPDFDDLDDDMTMPSTPVGSLPGILHAPRSNRSMSPPLEKDEREFTQTADGLQKRKLAGESFTLGHGDNAQPGDPMKDDIFDDRPSTAVYPPVQISLVTSPAVRASLPPSSAKKEVEDNWLRHEKLLEWDHTPEDIELDELDCLLDAC